MTNGFLRRGNLFRKRADMQVPDCVCHTDRPVLPRCRCSILNPGQTSRTMASRVARQGLRSSAHGERVFSELGRVRAAICRQATRREPQMAWRW